MKVVSRELSRWSWSSRVCSHACHLTLPQRGLWMSWCLRPTTVLALCGPPGRVRRPERGSQSQGPAGLTLTAHGTFVFGSISTSTCGTAAVPGASLEARLACLDFELQDGSSWTLHPRGSNVAGLASDGVCRHVPVSRVAHESAQSPQSVRSQVAEQPLFPLLVSQTGRLIGQAAWEDLSELVSSRRESEAGVLGTRRREIHRLRY